MEAMGSLQIFGLLLHAFRASYVRTMVFTFALYDSAKHFLYQ
ncbi:MAG: hypothetical protein AVDCRST_MAG14-449 [uncultured Rubrobacteraceae bacterium]|uniref:Uncharacterized protein n=1 Tax=uncultured Rubrobacteraceae bacterium TaxID=349277 RepID=A0A6J4QIZ4_9ACTN|nr:MAG: hypothetical protein AVDCRST_MAG14-449 [uncultured Rubrobacteraceae bacterium]